MERLSLSRLRATSDRHCQASPTRHPAGQSPAGVSRLSARRAPSQAAPSTRRGALRGRAEPARLLDDARRVVFRQDQWNRLADPDAYVVELVSKLGLSRVAYDRCIAGGGAAKRVQASVAGKAVEFSGTPQFRFLSPGIPAYPLSGAHPLARFTAVADAMLAGQTPAGERSRRTPSRGSRPGPRGSPRTRSGRAIRWRAIPSMAIRKPKSSSSSSATFSVPRVRNIRSRSTGD